MNLKKVLATICVSVMAFSMAFMVTGCGNNSEEVIRQSLADELDAYKNAEDSAMSEIATSAENEGIEDLGITGEEFAAAVLDGFDYEIESVEVDGNKAVATIVIVSKSYTAFQEKVDAVTESMASDTELADMTREEAMKRVGDMIMDAFKDTPTVNETTQIEYTLSNNVWKPVNSREALAKLDSVVFSR